MARRNQARKVGQIDFVADSLQSIEIPRKYPIRQIVLDVNGSLVIGTAGSPVLYTGGCGSALKVVKRIELIANGRDTLKSISASALAMKNTFLHSTQPQLTETGLTAATHPFGGVVVLDVAMPRAVRPEDTLLDTGKLSTLDLRVTFGDGDDMFSTNPTAITSTDCDIQVSMKEAIDLTGKDELYSTYKEYYIEAVIAAASTEHQILLPVGNRYRGFMIECESDGEMVDTILNSVKFQSGTDVYFTMDADDLAGENAITFDLQDQSRTGYYYVDLCPTGQMVDALDATALSRLEAIVDVNAPGTTDIIRIYPCEIISPIVR